MKFYIKIEETRDVVVEVDASNVDEAYDKVENAYSEGDICLDNANYMVEASLNDETTRYKHDIELGYIPDRFKKI